MSNPYENYEAPVTEGLYHKFEDGKIYKVRLLTDPVVFINTFTNKVNGEVKDRTKYAWIVYNFELKSAQIMQLPVTAFKMIQKFAKNAEYGDPKGYDLTISRSGTVPRVQYEVVAGRTSKPTPDAILALIEDIDLIEKIEEGESNSNVKWLTEATEDGAAPATPANVDTTTVPAAVEASADDEW